MSETVSACGLRSMVENQPFQKVAHSASGAVLSPANKGSLSKSGGKEDTSGFGAAPGNGMQASALMAAVTRGGGFGLLRTFQHLDLWLSICLGEIRKLALSRWFGAGSMGTWLNGYLAFQGDTHFRTAHKHVSKNCWQEKTRYPLVQVPV